MSLGLSPLSSSTSATQTAVGEAPRSAPLGIASTNSWMVSCAPRCGLEVLWNTVCHLMACVWSAILGMFGREHISSVPASQSPVECRELSLRIVEQQDDRMWQQMIRTLSVEVDEVRARTLDKYLNPEILQRICGERARIFEHRIESDQLDRNCAEFDMAGVLGQLDSELVGNVGVFIDGARYRSSRKILELLLQRGVEGQKAVKILASLTHKGCREASSLVSKLFAKQDGQELLRRHAILAPAEIPIRAEVKFENSPWGPAPVLKEVEITVPFEIVGGPFLRKLFTISTVTRIDGTTGHAVVTGTTAPIQIAR